MINPGDHDALALGISIAEERPDALKIGVMIASLVEKHRRHADASAVARMSRPLGDIERHLALAEKRAANVRMMDSPEGLLAMDLKWACEELRRRAGLDGAFLRWAKDQLDHVVSETYDDWTWIGSDPAERAAGLAELEQVGKALGMDALVAELRAFVEAREAALAREAPR